MKYLLIHYHLFLNFKFLGYNLFFVYIDFLKMFHVFMRILFKEYSCLFYIIENFYHILRNSLKIK